MGFFSKKDETKNVSLPRLPEIPSLSSEFSEMDEDYSEDGPHELPSFPNNSMGNKFSQETIKNAISGDYDSDEEEEMPEPLIPIPTFKIPQKISSKNNFERKTPQKKSEEESEKERGPVFIRIDKFEQALEIFKDTKEKIDDIEKLLSETKELKEREEEELSMWEKEIQEMKSQIEKVDKDIFSKI